MPRPVSSSETPPPARDAIPLHRSDVDLVRLAQSTLEPLMRDAAELEVSLAIDGNARLGLASVDPEKIAWVIATLAGNALRYVRRGSRHMPGGNVVVRLGRDDAARAVTITVEDDGPGIPKEKLPYLFERKAGAQHAIGLALTLVKDIVVAHGGAVRVESHTDFETHGTRVHVTLPRS